MLPYSYVCTAIPSAYHTTAAIFLPLTCQPGDPPPHLEFPQYIPNLDTSNIIVDAISPMLT